MVPGCNTDKYFTCSFKLRSYVSKSHYVSILHLHDRVQAMAVLNFNLFFVLFPGTT